MRVLLIALILLVGTEEVFSSTFQLSIVHMGDQEAAMDALFDAPRASAVISKLKKDYPNTITLSSGDNYISGPFFKSSKSDKLTPILGPNAVEGMADILIQNAFGFQASVLGNHEFDIGPDHLATLLTKNGSYEGTKFPYLSSNIDFSQSILNSFVTGDGQEASGLDGRIARSTVITVNGEKIGIVGATTPTLPQIQVTGKLQVFPANVTDFQALASIIQKSVDELTSKGINKIILLSHMQNLSIEEELSKYLRDVDVIIGGGSDAILADSNDRLRTGDQNLIYGEYPLWKKDLSDNDVAIINLDGQYRYVGRLVLDFDSKGVVIKESYDALVSGAFATDEQGLIELGSPSPIPSVTKIVNVIKDLNLAKDKNIFGITTEYLDARKSVIRSSRTNLGNLITKANLWYAKKYDNKAIAAITNSGGIRASIGVETVLPGATKATRMPPQATSYKPEGAITQLLIESTLAFNNTLCLVSLTPQQIKVVLEEGLKGHPVAIGAYPQVANIDFEFDHNKTAQVYDPVLDQITTQGNRITKLVIDSKTVFENGAFHSAFKNKLFRIVTAEYLLVHAGDNYPFRVFTKEDPVNSQPECLYQPGVNSGNAVFAEDGKEQDALAEYILEHY